MFGGSIIVSLVALSSACPCKDAKLCRSNGYMPPNEFARDREIFGFAAGVNYEMWDWTQISTVAWPSDPQLICEAHKHGARVVTGNPAINLTALTGNPTAIKEWVAGAVKLVKEGGYDGMTFDYESPLRWNDPAVDTYVNIINATRAALRTAVPKSQVSTCVAWSPDDIDGRGYNARGLSEASDLLYIMDYDTRSQIFDRCIASANSPSARAARSISRWIDLGIHPSKLILGIPWYGYDYKCLKTEMESESSKFCPLPFVPFRGVNCSDAAGGESPFANILEVMRSNKTVHPGRRWDASTMTPYFNYKDTNGDVHQVWYDDAESMAVKYRIARESGIRGTGPFTFDDLQYSTAQQREDAASMWKALKNF